MRQIREPQFQFGQVPIEELRFVGDSRDDIRAILRGLQQLYCTRSVYRPVMALLEKQLLAKVNARTGRPGLDLWQILVLGILKQGCASTSTACANWRTSIGRCGTCWATGCTKRRTTGCSGWSTTSRC